MKTYREIRAFVLELLSNELSPNLTYHGVHHTLDVLGVVDDYIRRDKIPVEEAELLKVGALLHDIGFINTYTNHEEEGVRIAKDLLKNYGLSKAEFSVIEGLIMATKVPQKPATHLEKIICDADLDYLGRNDFEKISESLFQELQNQDILHDRDNWNRIQVKFLEQHSYHTEFARKHRQPEKAKRLEEIKQTLPAV
jgi:HD superfamily phosphodiesterase